VHFSQSYLALQLLDWGTKIQPETHMSSFSTYLIGFVVLIIGLAIAAILLGVSQTWVVVGAIILIGIGILMATTRTKPKDPPSPPVA
jgi:positive regulator of sigma E activity